jgi:hypothetical protein
MDWMCAEPDCALSYPYDNYVAVHLFRQEPVQQTPTRTLGTKHLASGTGVDSSHSSLLSLPDAVLALIFGQLHWRDVCSLHATSHATRQLACSEVRAPACYRQPTASYPSQKHRTHGLDSHQPLASSRLCGRRCMTATGQPCSGCLNTTPLFLLYPPPLVRSLPSPLTKPPP